MSDQERMYIEERATRAHWLARHSRFPKCGYYEVFPLADFPEDQRARLEALPMCQRCTHVNKPKRKPMRVAAIRAALDEILALHQSKQDGPLSLCPDAYCGTCYGSYLASDGYPSFGPASYPCPTAAAITKLKESL